MKNAQQILPLLLVFIGLFISQNVFGQVSILMDNDRVKKGERVCVDLVVEDFDDLITATFAVKWDPTVLRFENTEQHASILNPAGDLNEGKTDEGKLFLLWVSSGAAQSLPDGQILFTICFTAIGEPGAESKVAITGTEADPGIDFVDSNGESVGIGSAFDAIIEIEIQDIPDNAVFLYFDDIIITSGESFCVPIRVRNFTKMGTLQFSLDFNTNRFEYTGRTFAEDKGGQWSVSPVQSTDKEIKYSAFDFSFTAEGVSLDDGSRLIEICFDHLLTDDVCVFEEILLASNPLPIDASKIEDDFSSIDIPVVYEPGKIRLRTPIDYNSPDVTPVTCREPNIGAISVNASGGTAGIKYLWNTGDTTSTITGLSAGRYDISISDVCLAVDTIFRSFEVKVDGDAPSANAGEDVNLICGLESVSLDGIGSSSGSAITFSWRGIDGQSILSGASDVVAEVNQEGSYEILVMDIDNGCSAVDTVEVIDLRTLPNIMAGMDVRLECDDISIALNGSGDSGINFDYDWTTDDGNIIDRPSKEGIVVDRTGIYILRITDKSSGCAATDEVVVSGGNITPNLGIAGSFSIDCNTEIQTLDANITEESGVSYSWSTTTGSIMSGADQFQVIVNEPGFYEVRATNDASGCTSSDQALIRNLRSTPIAMAGDDSIIDCNVDDVTLTGSGSTGPGFEYSWVTSDGSIVSQTSDGQAIVNSAGTYTFTVLETENGCSTSDDLVVTGDNERPQASISGSTILDCNTTTLSLNANNGAGAVAGISYQWMTTDGSFASGADQVGATVEQPGTYTVRVTNDASGCTDNSTVTVTSEAEEPMISAGGDESIDCSTEILTLTGTSDNMANVNFQWNLVGGNGQILSGATNAAAEVMGAGKYELVVTNPLNGCTSRDTTEVLLNGSLPAAQLDMDYDQCEPETILMGNQEGGVTGLWTVINGSSVLEDPMDRNCQVNSLSEGINTFVWTLSSSGCPEYSSDTININFVGEPIAVDDIFNVNQGFGSLDIDLLGNDQFSSEMGATINLTTEPSLGVLIENSNGQFTYTLDNPNAFGTYTFEYEICDDLCSLNCDIGMVTIDVRDGSLPSVDTTTVSNEPQSLGITPNGDGLNDQLVFDELITNSDKYGTKRLIVYNRWGDIVHEAQPYNNDWGGTNRGGSLLPQGTYYFVMQLDLGQGAVIEGDITILQ